MVLGCAIRSIHPSTLFDPLVVALAFCVGARHDQGAPTPAAQRHRRRVADDWLERRERCHRFTGRRRGGRDPLGAPGFRPWWPHGAASDASLTLGPRGRTLAAAASASATEVRVGRPPCRWVPSSCSLPRQRRVHARFDETQRPEGTHSLTRWHPGGSLAQECLLIVMTFRCRSTDLVCGSCR